MDKRLKYLTSSNAKKQSTLSDKILEIGKYILIVICYFHETWSLSEFASKSVKKEAH